MSFWPGHRTLKCPRSLDESYKQLLAFSAIFSCCSTLAAAVQPFEEWQVREQRRLRAAAAQQPEQSREDAEDRFSVQACLGFQWQVRAHPALCTAQPALRLAQRAGAVEA